MLSAGTESSKKAVTPAQSSHEARMLPSHVQPTIEIVRGELERLFSLEEMTSIS